jgi:hypothetical protein
MAFIIGNKKISRCNPSVMFTSTQLVMFRLVLLETLWSHLAKYQKPGNVLRGAQNPKHILRCTKKETLIKTAGELQPTMRSIQTTLGQW